ncbi:MULTISPECIES: DUF998 domain-containing protein [Methanobacterium]|jgi:hypothetical membrane protein|uniref:DUF998 domain-containing protein n=1 Tax=Methanobacterium bryantii TaxID=2161 RepID=A0A2A2H158_METBR|nr:MULTISPECIES: DUF998 domain-containing protein [Methanobacterium]OEC86362.1 hypothetical protein A9507_00300 [Methanobacterium sp. A39]PAV03023.1 hypothetical protein ASJ80_07045 [Methanobacterium bryantii]
MISKTEAKSIRYQKTAGLLMVISGIQFMLLVSVAETLYPGYNTAKYDLSSLADLPIHEPSATIFNVTVFIAGLLVFIAAYFIYKRYQSRIFPAFLGILGIGAMGVGIFPGYSGNAHVIFAMTSFIFGSLAMLTSFTILRDSLLKYVLIILGAVAFIDILLVIILQDSSPFMVFGTGGAERLIVYPVILGVIALGGYLTGSIHQES